MIVTQERIAVIGLGYVGLPVALALSKKFPYVIGYDVSKEKISSLNNHIDPTGELSQDVLSRASLVYTNNIQDLHDSTFFIVAVPTPINEAKQPNLSPLIHASQAIGTVLTHNTVVVYESTVYPGVTEEICGPILAETSGLTQGVDFKLAYSPERINPGDNAHTLEKIIKVVAAEDTSTLERVSNIYRAVIDAGIYQAPSIKVAEAAKVIENTQRDLNIALMNELARIFDKMNIRTADVLAAAKTKWNFLPFTPGLVGGHCIGVDPYYLTYKAEKLGYTPEVILAGRRINDTTAQFIANKLIKLLSQKHIPLHTARIGIFGLTFKENVSDLRNSKVPDMIAELAEYGLQPMIHDPHACSDQAQRDYNLQLSHLNDMTSLDALILAVPHDTYQLTTIYNHLQPNGIIIDIKSRLDSQTFPPTMTYWSL